MNRLAGYKEVSRPRIRFIEFENQTAWKPVLMKEALDFQAGYPFSSDFFTEEPLGLRLVRNRDLKFDDRITRYTGEIDDAFIVQDGDLLVGMDGDFAPVIWRKGRALLNQRVGRIIPKGKNSKRFLYYLLSIALKELENSTARTTVKHLSHSDVEKLALPLPIFPEQQKIADCLSSLDELIAAEMERLEALRAHKKGLMQVLFPAEGERVPKVRFSCKGNWSITSLPEVVFFQEGPGIMAVDFCDEGIPLVRLSGIGGPTVTLEGCNYLDPDKVTQKWEHFRLCQNDILISTSASFGLTSIVTETAIGAVFYTGLIRFRSTSETLDHGYLNVFLGSPPFENQARAAAVGGGIKHFGPTHLKQMEIHLPPINEQQKIAACLSSVDELIAEQEARLEGLRAHKRGLMQALFPVGEVE